MLAHTTYAAHSLTGPNSSQHLAPESEPSTLSPALPPPSTVTHCAGDSDPSPHFLYCCSPTAMFPPRPGLTQLPLPSFPSSQVTVTSYTLSHPTQTGAGSNSPMSQRWPPVKAPSWMGMDHRNPGHTAGQRPSHHILLVPARVLPPALSSQYSPDPRPPGSQKRL